MVRALIAALYKFTTLDDIAEMRPLLERRCEEGGIKGTLLLANEGINGTLAGPEESVRDLLSYLRSDPRLADLKHKESWADDIPFHRLKVRIKKEIVTLGIPSVDPTERVGQYVKPADWNALIARPDVVLIDTRNDYEVEIGTFEGAISPDTDSFTDFPEWSKSAEALENKSKVAMFCTGGIRCEKASSFLLAQGVKEVYHLEGGILKYLEEVPQKDSRWQGECFVFDGRVSVNHQLEPGKHTMCFGCRRAVSDEARQSPQYMEGVCCPYCHDSLSDDQRERFGERHKQIQLAAERDEVHIGRRMDQTQTRPKADLGSRALPVLYSFRRCPYAMRARMTLVATDHQVELREVALKNKPEHMLALSPKGTVPVMWLRDGTVIDESLEIMLWALERHDPLQLSAQTAEEQAEMLALIAENDGDFKDHLNRYKYADRYEGVNAEEQRDAAESFLARLETRLSDQSYLFGNRRTLADMAIAPFIRQFANTDLDWFAAAPYPFLRSWLEAELTHEHFTTAMKKYRPWEASTLGPLFPED